MNKTVSINLGGLFFHIDEDAYQKLNRYFDAIKRSLSPDGKDEIMNDIESRIAELLSEKLKNDKQVVGIREIDEVIAVMGQPEDYKIDEETTGSSHTYFPPGYNPIRPKKFYRDGDKGMIAGVCAGIAHYFRIDPLWIRIIFIISLFLSFGASVFVYILFWILIPKAITTTEKLEMTGEPINISNIEKKVREEIDSISSKLQNVDYDKISANAKTGAERLGNGIGNVFMTIFKALAKVIGAFITVFSAVGLGAVIIFSFVVFFSSGIQDPDSPFYQYEMIFNHTDVPVWVVSILSLLAAGIPLFFLLLLGLKILIDNLKPIGNITKYTLIAIWLISVAFIIYISVRQASEFGHDGKIMKNEQINIAKNDTLYIKFRHNEYFAKTVDYNREFLITQDSTENDVLYSNNVELYFMKTDAEPYLQIERTAQGRSITEARKRAEKINYNFNLQGNNLILDNYLLTDISTKFRNQKVKVFVYLPQGSIVHADESIRHYHRGDYSGLYIPYNDESHLYQLKNDEMICLDCPDEEEEISEDEASITISNEKDTIYISADTIKLNNSSIRVKTTVKK